MCKINSKCSGKFFVCLKWKSTAPIVMLSVLGHANPSGQPHKDERSQKQFFKLRKKLESRPPPSASGAHSESPRSSKSVLRSFRQKPLFEEDFFLGILLLPYLHDAFCPATGNMSVHSLTVW